MTHVKSLDLAPRSAWFKSSYSQNTGNSCVEVANLDTRVGVRDSKQSNGPALTLAPAAWAAFVGYVKA
ncbi:DUF397 domain-containing protein [Streptomyces qinzhouensis]|uniref:DUF397 domain-containing protein n=1 Tax=Streptomyces qinzhouensis TaxID=2599401 RepID=A0A5B8IGT3_9ACTN|nr:DUF397 domain-containing protein [Streptomyces qinzhouensis]QDY77422.1 DUF397 domain-containing protein [Streptomyces qinzhouensis]